jgi:hypothetical protein
MALIFEFRKSQSQNRKATPLGQGVTGSIVFFTGIRYERIAPAEVVAAAACSVARKPARPRRAKPIEAVG